MTTLENVFKSAVGRASDTRGKPGVLGRVDGSTLYWTDSAGVTQRNRVWVRIGESDSRQEIVAMCWDVSPQFDLPVRIDNVNGVPTVVSVDQKRAEEFANGRPGFAVPAHAWLHGRHGPDPIYIDGLQFLPFLVTPTDTASMNVSVKGGSYRWQGDFNIYETGNGPSLASYVPSTATNKHFVIIALDRDTNQIEIIDGNDISASGGDALFPGGGFVTREDILAVEIEPHYLPLAVVLLYYGQVKISVPDITNDVRLWGMESGGVNWIFDGYVSGDTYYRGDMLRINKWTRIANTTTTDNPDITPSGEPYWLREIPGTPPAWASLSQSTNYLLVGVRIEAQQSGYLTGNGFYIPSAAIGTTAEMLVIVNPLTDPEYTVIIPEFEVTSGNTDSWVELPQGAIPAIEGITLDVVMGFRATTGASSFNGDWDYVKGNGDPDPGGINHQSGGAEMRISHTDANGGNRQTELESLTPGETITGDGTVWTIQSITNDTDFISVTVTPSSRSNTGTYNFVFDQYGVLPIAAVQVVNWYTGEGHINGLISTNGYDNITTNNNLYGVDIEVQSVDASDEWDTVAYSSIASGSTGAGGVSAEFGNTANPKRITVDYTVLPHDTVLLCDTDAGPINLQLLPGDSLHNQLRIVNCGSNGNLVTIIPSGIQLLVGANASKTINDKTVIILNYHATEGWW